MQSKETLGSFSARFGGKRGYSWRVRRTAMGIVVAAAVGLFGSSRLEASESEAPRWVDLAVVGDLPPEDESALRRLLESELTRRGLELHVDHGISDARELLARARPGALLLVMLDARAPAGWRLVLIDAIRKRAVVRELPAGPARDAASIEAASNIVESAAFALREGLGVASLSVDEALGGSAPTAAPAASGGALASGVPKSSSYPSSEAYGNAAIALASFDREAPVSAGVAATLGIWLRRVDLHVTVARYLGSTIAASTGRFLIDRTQFVAAAAYRFRARPLQIDPGVGIVAELLHRGDALPSADAAVASASNDTVRWGPLWGVSVELAVSNRLATTAALTMAYFPQRVRYMAAGQTTETLAAPWGISVAAMFGVQVAVFP
jgi:hypothetical protein